MFKIATQYRTYVILCMLVCFFAAPGLAAEPPQEHRVRCGDYSYVLPEGFTAFDMPQPFPTDKVYLNTRDNPVRYKADAGITCIRKETTGNREYLLESARVVEELPNIKHMFSHELVLFDEEMTPGVRVYHKRPYSASRDLNWTEVLGDVYAKGSDTHVILYFWCLKNYRTVHRDGRKPLFVEFTYDELKERTLKFVRSIRKEQ